MTYMLEIFLFILAFLIVQWDEKKKRRKRWVYFGFAISLVLFASLQVLNSRGDTKKDKIIEGLNRNIEGLQEEIRGLTFTINQQSVMLEQLRNLLLAALPDDVLKKAEALYHKAIINMEKGNKLESAKAFQELSNLALGVNSYNYNTPLNSDHRLRCKNVVKSPNLGGQNEEASTVSERV